MDAFKSPNISIIEDADCLVEASGAVLFDGDLVMEVMQKYKVGMSDTRLTKL